MLFVTNPPGLPGGFLFLPILRKPTLPGQNAFGKVHV